MKHIAIILFFITGLISCVQENDRIETILLDCLESSYNEIEVDLNRELDILEKYLIDKGALKSSAGQSYYDIYKQVVEINDIPNELDIDKFENLLKLRPNEYYSNICLQSLTEIDSDEIKKSKYYQLTLKMQEFESTEETSPSTVANAIISVLSPADFDKPYYRAMALLTILNISNIETGLVRKMKPVKPVDYSDYQTVSIIANSKNEIIYITKIVNEKTLKSELYNFIKQYQENHLIAFSCEKGTTYDFYLKVQDCISETYTRLRDEKSKELYKKSYSDLMESEKEIVKEIYPQNIQE
jgi:hypothetical protein